MSKSVTYAQIWVGNKKRGNITSSGMTIEPGSSVIRVAGDSNVVAHSKAVSSFTFEEIQTDDSTDLSVMLDSIENRETVKMVHGRVGGNFYSSECIITSIGIQSEVEGGTITGSFQLSAVDGLPKKL